MRPGMPGQHDRAIGDRDIGGQGGGRIICPIFHTLEDGQENFYADDDREFLGPPTIDAFAEKGLIRVLFVPSLFYYTLETHYRDDPGTATLADRDSAYRRRNWVNLVTRLQVDPLNRQEIDAVIDKIVIPVLAPADDPRPSPRQKFLEVRTTMRNHIVLRESHSTAIQPTGRTTQRLAGLERRRRALVRTSGDLREDGRLPRRNGG